MELLKRIERKIVSLSELQQQLSNRKGVQVVFTNGCFDILHRGHASYLAQARDLGDLLIVGLNSDQSVRRLKGNSRPINDEYSRALLLASLCVVDYVITFEEDTPFNLISKLLPNVLVKGGDYTRDAIVGADIVEAHGGSVVTIPFVEGYSTTSILKRKEFMS